MEKYRLNSLMAGILYFLGTAFGIASVITGGEVLSSIVSHRPLDGLNLLEMVSANSLRLLGGSFFILLMGISLVAMTVYLYPVIKKDSEVLAMGMLLFRGALEGAWYFVSTMSALALVTLGNEYVVADINVSVLESIGNVMYQFQGLLGSVGSIFFLIGATCLYVSFYRTSLIPRWLSVWGLVGVIPYLLYAVLNFFNIEHEILLYLQMVLAPQEIIMALWLIIKGFDTAAVDKLMQK